MFIFYQAGLNSIKTIKKTWKRAIRGIQTSTIVLQLTKHMF